MSICIHTAEGHILNVSCPENDTLARGIWLSPGLRPPALCSGLGRCGRCRVRFLSSPPLPSDVEKQVLSPEEFSALTFTASQVRVAPELIDYAVRLVSATRSYAAIETGSGPRGSLALIRCARGRALLERRDFVIPDDIKALAVPVLIHRISLSAESDLEGLNELRVVETLVSRVEAPRGEYSD